MFSFVDIRLGLLLCAVVLVVRGQGEDDSEYMIFTPAFLQRCLTEEIGELKRGIFSCLVASDLQSKTSWECLEEEIKTTFLFSSTFFYLLENVIFPSCRTRNLCSFLERLFAARVQLHVQRGRARAVCDVLERRMR